MSLQALEALIRHDMSAVKLLEAVREDGPQGAFVAAGFVRNRYWDSLYPSPPQAVASDIDVIYYDQGATLKAHDLAYETSLRQRVPNAVWQVRNQARMHTVGGHAPFSDIETAMRHWPETATGIGVRMLADGALEWITAFGFDDLFDHILRITPVMKATDAGVFEKRLTAKGWLDRWPRLTVIRA